MQGTGATPFIPARERFAAPFVWQQDALTLTACLPG
jgi:hypothetical protein